MALSMLLFVSCADEVDTDNYFLSGGYLTVDKTSISLDGTADKATIAVKANCHWTITGVPDWLTVSQQSGDNSQTVTLSASRNTSVVNDRTATISFQTDDGLKRQVAIRQSKLVETLSLSVNELQLSASGDQKTFVVQSNAQWSIMGSESWFLLSITKGDGNQEVTVQAMQNTSEDERSATLTVHGTDRSATITLRQAGMDVNLTATPLSLTFDAMSQAKTLQLSGNAHWTVTASADWVSIDKLEGTGTEKLNISCADNTNTTSRTAVVTISWKDGKFECELIQSAASLPLLTATIASNVGRYSVTVTSAITSMFPITESGFCYSKANSEPTLADMTINVTPDAQGTMTSEITDLESHVRYYVRSYAVSAVGTAYGPILEFTTVGGVPDEGDNPKPNV
jgi:hypothetical protein